MTTSSVLFVCLANTCRSPAAEGVLRHLAEKQGLDCYVESCGVGAWNVGQLPSEKMREATQKRGIHLASRSQQFDPQFFDRFDLILVADREVLNELYHYAKTPQHKGKIHLITHFSSAYKDQVIPDPYYGGEAGFEHVLDMIEDSCHGIIKEIQVKGI
ncbi:MAG: low molecular weight protein-tyrosine-phosphatase [Parachlamydiaceae bacterium]